MFESFKTWKFFLFELLIISCVPRVLTFINRKRSLQLKSQNSFSLLFFSDRFEMNLSHSPFRCHRRWRRNESANAWLTPSFAPRLLDLHHRHHLSSYSLFLIEINSWRLRSVVLLLRNRLTGNSHVFSINRRSCRNRATSIADSGTRLVNDRFAWLSSAEQLLVIDVA